MNLLISRNCNATLEHLVMKQIYLYNKFKPYIIKTTLDTAPQVFSELVLHYYTIYS